MTDTAAPALSDLNQQIETAADTEADTLIKAGEVSLEALITAKAGPTVAALVMELINSAGPHVLTFVHEEIAAGVVAVEAAAEHGLQYVEGAIERTVARAGVFIREHLHIKAAQDRGDAPPGELMPGFADSELIGMFVAAQIAPSETPPETRFARGMTLADIRAQAEKISEAIHNRGLDEGAARALQFGRTHVGEIFPGVTATVTAGASPAPAPSSSTPPALAALDDATVRTLYQALHAETPPALPEGWTLEAVRLQAETIDAEAQRRGLTSAAPAAA